MLLDVQVIKSVSGKNNPQAPYSGSIMIHSSIRRRNLKTHLGNLFLSMIRRTVHTYCALLNSSGDVRTGLSVLESSVNNQAHQLRKKNYSITIQKYWQLRNSVKHHPAGDFSENFFGNKKHDGLLKWSLAQSECYKNGRD